MPEPGNRQARAAARATVKAGRAEKGSDRVEIRENYTVATPTPVPPGRGARAFQGSNQWLQAGGRVEVRENFAVATPIPLPPPPGLRAPVPARPAMGQSTVGGWTRSDGSAGQYPCTVGGARPYNSQEITIGVLRGGLPKDPLDRKDPEVNLLNPYLRGHISLSTSAVEFADAIIRAYECCMYDYRRRADPHALCCIGKITRAGHCDAGLGGKQTLKDLDEERKAKIKKALCAKLKIFNSSCYGFDPRLFIVCPSKVAA